MVPMFCFCDAWYSGGEHPAHDALTGEKWCSIKQYKNKEFGHTPNVADNTPNVFLTLEWMYTTMLALNKSIWDVIYPKSGNFGGIGNKVITPFSVRRNIPVENRKTTYNKIFLSFHKIAYRFERECCQRKRCAHPGKTRNATTKNNNASSCCLLIFPPPNAPIFCLL